ncbi:hypothetical protein O0I10_011683 [Lichtheimia ornata]|uniref:DNA mismatch repair protein MSH3 n=1 Tax=Lichtheimia ornata TaxID=688661 RepID=A0AAD7UUU8_9FUNG|nr:uncharacterized protein O0I10_011683 [Lichtheimia ornata]KAJ8652676.1 hypothetical protein O0I10_011683 [Lichtheimia ornata]
MHPKHRLLSSTSSSAAEASSNPNTSSRSNGRVKKNKAVDMTRVDHPPSVLSIKSSALDTLKYTYNDKFAGSSIPASSSLLPSSNSSITTTNHGNKALLLRRRKIASTEGSFIMDHESSSVASTTPSLSQKRLPASTPINAREQSLPSTSSILHSHGSATPKAALQQPSPPTQSLSYSGRHSVVTASSHGFQPASASRPATINRPLVPATVASVRDRRLMVLAEGRGVSPEVGICIVHVTTGECTLSQVPDTPSYSRTLHKIHLNDPHKILFANTALEPGATQLYQLVNENFPEISTSVIPRKYFSDDVGMKDLQEYGLEEDASSLMLGLSTKYYCLAAVAAAFKYIAENEGLRFARHTVKFTYQGVEDVATARNLELVSNIMRRNSKDTLFGVLNHTVTPMGSRLLRTNILQPSTDEALIRRRLDAVQELISQENLLFDIQAALKPVADLDHIIADIVRIPTTQDLHYTESKINNVIRLKILLAAVKTVANSLEAYNLNDLLGAILELLSDPKLAPDEFVQDINQVLHDDVGVQKTALGLRHQRCYAVKAGVNGLLDVARQSYKETMEDIYEMATEYCQTTNLNIKLQFNASRGFFLTLPVDQLKGGEGDLPSIFINVIKKKKLYSFATIELLQKNSRMNESLAEIYLMSDNTVTELLQRFHADIGVLYKVTEAIAMLDMLLSFAHSCSLTQHVRPEFTSTLAIEAGRHPIMEHIQKEPVVPNNTFASLSSSFQIITGPNMSGKSTYIRQVALLTIIAHMGSFVPASYASFRLCDQILSRLLGNDGCLEQNTSSFIVEMREAAYIIQNITDTSLVVLDELGKGTAPYDALGITAAITECLSSSKAYCFFATHFHQLTHVLHIYPNIVNLQLHVDVINNPESHDCTLSYSYTVRDGAVAKDQHYGLKTAELLGFPSQIIMRALQITEKLAQPLRAEPYKDSQPQSMMAVDGNSSKSIDNNNNNSSSEDDDAEDQARCRTLYWFADKMLQLQGAPDEVFYDQVIHVKEMLAKQIEPLESE